MAGSIRNQTIASTGVGAAVTLLCRHPDNRATILLASAPAGAQFLVRTASDYLVNATPNWVPRAVFDTNLMAWIQGTTVLQPSSYPYSFDVDMANQQGVQVYAVTLPGGVPAVVSLSVDNYYTSSPPMPGPQGPSGPQGPAGPSGVSGPSGPSGPTGS